MSLANAPHRNGGVAGLRQSNHHVDFMRRLFFGDAPAATAHDRNGTANGKPYPIVCIDGEIATLNQLEQILARHCQ
ncbi:MAG: hypothetical protein ACLPTZ_15610, partial [Beijerinckiaceae bacterium]